MMFAVMNQKMWERENMAGLDTTIKMFNRTNISHYLKTYEAEILMTNILEVRQLCRLARVVSKSPCKDPQDVN